MHITAEGVVLKQNKLPNNRRIIVLFTREYGKIQVGANASERGKSKSTLALRPFTYAEYEIFKSRGYYHFNGASVRRSYYAIGEDLDRFLTASKALNYLEQSLPEEQRKPGLFDLTLDFFGVLESAKGNTETILDSYIVKTLPMHGIQPELGQCVNCGKDLSAFGSRPAFSVSGGGILCEDCAGALQKDGNSLILKPGFDIVEVLRYLMKQPLSHFTRVTLKPEMQKQIRRILSEYLDYYLNIDVLNDDLGIAGS